MHMEKMWNSVQLFSRYWVETKFWHKSKGKKLTAYNPNQDFVNINAYILFGEILSILSHDSEWKRNSAPDQET